MLFNSLEFAIFFPLVCVAYFLATQRVRIWILLAASCVFYMAFVPAYILILLITILVDYFAGIYLEKLRPSARKPLLLASIVVTCLILFIFKYFYFFTDTFIGLTGLFGYKIEEPTLRVILPIGLSFHTFQSLSYVVEVYRGHQKAERDFITYATFVMFFPQLVAGPIERPQNLLNQFHERHAFDYDNVVAGLKRMAWGFFKKLVVADRLALYVNDVYAAPSHFNGLQITIATVFFAYQIYCDFSGYSDIAIGSARVLGFRLMENFDSPYHSTSITEFWRRWHISLSTWFRDYVYIPLGGSKVPAQRWIANILVTFGLSGLWHGANWTYVAWGLLNGVYLVVGRFTKATRDTIAARLGFPRESLQREVVSIVITFLLTCVTWTLFRAQTFKDASYILTNFFRDWDFTSIETPNFQLKHFPAAVASIFALEMFEYIRARTTLPQLIYGFKLPIRWAGYLIFIFGVILFGVYKSSQFIYFQF